MPTIVNFGMPRSGTTYIAVAFEAIGIKYIPTDFMPTSQRHKTEDRTRTFEEVEGYIDELDRTKWHGLKIGEGTVFHPAKTIFSQTNFDFLMDICPKPIHIIRTYRIADRNWKSIKYISYQDWTIEQAGAAMISECAGYWGIKNRYDVVSIDFDKIDDIAYLSRKLQFLPEHILSRYT